MGSDWSGGGMGWRGGSPGWSNFGSMASSLNLTDAQKQKAQSIFDAAHRQTQQLREQMYDKRKAYWNSQKPLTDAEIDKWSAERADLMAKMQSVRAKAFNNFYNDVLTAEQRAKYNDLHASSGPGPRMGGYGMCGRGQGRGWQ
jgi:Spy/CpxP family protein refolding chaperone